jgi:hypothetical protein
MQSSGKTGAWEEIHEIFGACNRRARTGAEAEPFSEDWKDPLQTHGTDVKRALDQGLRPRDVKPSMEVILHEGSEEEDIAEQLDAKLGLDGEKQNHCSVIQFRDVCIDQ